VKWIRSNDDARSRDKQWPSTTMNSGPI